MNQVLSNRNVSFCNILRARPGSVLLYSERRAANVKFIACCVYLNVHLNIIKQEVTCTVSPVYGD